MNNSVRKNNRADGAKLGRRSLLSLGLGLAASGAAALLPGTATANAPRPGRRRLGTLEVSAVGLGVQNRSRTYQTTVPYRPEMIGIIRAAFDRGVTFYDAAEAYGPLEVERILGEGVAPFRDKVVIATKFGWNIDPESRFADANLTQNLTLVELVKNWAKRKEATPAQIALAWLLAQKPWIVPIPGTTKLHRLQENTGADAVELTPEDLRNIEEAASQITVEGHRYGEGSERMVDHQKRRGVFRFSAGSRTVNAEDCS